MGNEPALCQCGHELRLHDRFGCVAWDYFSSGPQKCPCDRFRPRPPVRSVNGAVRELR